MSFRPVMWTRMLEIAETRREQVVDVDWPFSKAECMPLQWRLSRQGRNDAHHVGHVKKEQFQPPVLVGITVYKRRREEVELTLSCQCATAPLHTPRNVFTQTLCES